MLHWITNYCRRLLKLVTMYLSVCCVVTTALSKGNNQSKVLGQIVKKEIWFAIPM